ncbi:hypothetical protein DXG03_002922 [Asterophora parasitica]|uniref:Actin cytoskeleton-regulatory complex protein SLA1 n=1 Tax=Asterophora parasitica TaxID=117018 RepID=A0A9P7KDJ3_9AGAR|nr:hypothetical protein DXG03_002922 [Asterophora parasitica]
MSAQHEEYLAVLRASYDYEPQSDDEVAITEGQLLFLKERVDDDWWKVKIKGESQEEESPVGLVPAAYVEQADHTSQVKALYDYEAAADGELSVEEDEILLLFETEQDWILVQSAKEGGKAGFVPGNYVEPYTKEEAPPAPRIIVPPSAPRPVSTYVDPADRVASAKVTADGIKTWSVSEIDKKGKKKKGTLGVGNGSVFFASESDKTPVQKWQTADVQNLASEKAKHVNIDIGGATPINLHFYAGSKDNVEEIIAKLKSSKALSDAPRASIARAPSPEEAPAPKKATVHFSNDVSVIGAHEEEEEEEEEPPQRATPRPTANGNGHTAHSGDDGDIGTALYDFSADGDDELSISEGERLTILERDGDEWWKCRNAKGQEGVVPASYIEAAPAATSSRAPPQEEEEEEEDEAAAAEEQRRIAEEERLAKKQEDERAEQARKKAEAQQRAQEAAVAADAERKRRKEAAARTLSPPPPPAETKRQSSSSSSSSRPSAETNRPPADRTRVWHDRSGQFRVEAAFLGFNNGKLRLHKVNGVIVEVPAEKMSVEDMKYVERMTSKNSSSSSRPSPARKVSDDDIPLGLARSNTVSAQSSSSSRSAPPAKKSPKIDWFDFFLSAGCDLDDCTRYAASFEKDKLDETLLPDITESTMRSLGVREGDIIRINKAIEKRKPTDNLHKPSSYTQEQVRRDEELARQLQAQESGGSRAPAPNLFSSGPGGALKTQTRRGRPTPSKSLPPAAVDLKAISTVSDQIQRTSSPQILTPTVSTPVSAPPRSSSAAAAPIISGFDDDAWTNRPSSTKPVAASPAPRAPSAPPAPASTVVPTPPPAQAPAPPTPAPPPQPTVTPATTVAAPNLANTTQSDIFDQLSRLSELRRQTTPAPPPPASATPPVVVPPSYVNGLGMGSSPSPIGQINFNNPPQQPQQQQFNAAPQQSLLNAPYNGPRGPFAPVPANQTLLQPLIPTQTGFAGMIPTRPGAQAVVSPFANPSSFLSPQQTGFPSAQQPILSQPILSQPTGIPMNGFNPMQNTLQNTGAFSAAPLTNQFTGFNPNFGQSPFNNTISPPPPVPPLPLSLPLSLPSSPATNNTSPANIFAAMKSGTFATDNGNNNQPQPPLAAQATGWGQPYQGGGYMGFQR